MKFSIYGVNFQNKGAELMLHAVNQQISQWDRDYILAAHSKIGSFQQRRELGINHLSYRPSNKVPFTTDLISAAANMIPKPVRQHYKITLESEVDIVLDASGFAFSDQWGPEDTERMANLCLKWKKQSKKIILLPQAFGPFTSERIKQAFLTILNNVDLIFARDPVSYDLISELSSSMNNVKIAPDFTNLVKGLEPKYIQDLIGRPCIIPNYRMIDKTSSKASTVYVQFLAELINHLLERGLEPFILIHETNDYKLGTQLQAEVNKKVPIVIDNNPLYLKGILGKCQLLIGSRFHGLVSALSQGIPCLGAGWSHKYQMLFDSYNCSELLINPEGNLNESIEKLDSIIDEPSRSEIMEAIKIASENQKVLSRQMWSDIKRMLT
ncbi:polysaccharide pyruvyl transferase family protein [Mastigocoleus sp. MO_188.B34]|uniref:polysaccharide pyruvyl transferase family protein n=1 Tax=Mastigocoleus sp. MO_188.B34 TaxID=3036635 RepID=UPI00261F155A|nr:polysaccharide pyruvyl transferase family protein [Mastigocoleus sp. MO_188.B34]MDJ0696977.1 polysaccharide pyruvyl transferase family protein [Mastigocoleus sp. MO_188.B34]